MNFRKDKILIVGGYGSVGTVIVKILANVFPEKMIIAGRNKGKAQQLINDLHIQASAIKIDLATNDFNEIPFAEIHLTICCIEFLQNDNFILLCVKHQINYTELATSYAAFQRINRYSQMVNKSGICVIPGVGLMPGLSGVFAQNATLRLNKIRKVESFVLLGFGENHGLDAIRWMMDYADKAFLIKIEKGEMQVDSFTDPLKERLLSESFFRNFYRFDFGDQHIIANTMEVVTAQTRLAFDSKFITWLVAVVKKLGLFSWLTKVQPQTVKNWLSNFHFGTEKYAVQTHCYGDKNEIIYLAEGFNEAHGTGVVATYAIQKLYHSNVVGIRRLEELIQFDDFVQYLNIHQIRIKIEKP